MLHLSDYMFLPIPQYDGRVNACVCDGDKCNEDCISKCKAAKHSGAAAVRAAGGAAATLLLAVAAASASGALNW